MNPRVEPNLSPAAQAPSAAPTTETCPICGSARLLALRCKVICQGCRTIVQSCADL